MRRKVTSTTPRLQLQSQSTSPKTQFIPRAEALQYEKKKKKKIAHAAVQAKKSLVGSTICKKNANFMRRTTGVREADVGADAPAAPAHPFQPNRHSRSGFRQEQERGAAVAKIKVCEVHCN